jgi:hypothetical protein
MNTHDSAAGEEFGQDAERDAVVRVIKRRDEHRRI